MSNDALPFIFDCLASKNSRMQQKKAAPSEVTASTHPGNLTNADYLIFGQNVALISAQSCDT